MRWLEKLRAFNPWSIIGLLIIGLAIISSITKGLINQLAFNSRDYKGSIILTKEYYG